jgi:hypothetical protein
MMSLADSNVYSPLLGDIACRSCKGLASEPPPRKATDVTVAILDSCAARRKQVTLRPRKIVFAGGARTLCMHKVNLAKTL